MIQVQESKTNSTSATVSTDLAIPGELNKLGYDLETEFEQEVLAVSY